MQSARFVALFTLLLALSAARASEPPTVGALSVEPGTTPLVAEELTFTVNATSPATLTLSMVWTFGDGTELKGNPVVHRYSAAGTYKVEVRVSDGVNAAVNESIQIEVLDPPNLETSPGLNLGDTLSHASANGTIGLAVSEQRSGYTELTLSRSDEGSTRFRTTWGDGSSRAVIGARPRHVYKLPGVYLVSTVARDTVTGEELATLKKLLVVTDPSTIAVLSPEARALKLTKLKGKLDRRAGKLDSVQLVLTLDVPKEALPTAEGFIDLGLGSLIQRLAFDARGAALPDGSIAKAKIKWPKRQKLADGQNGRVQITLVLADEDLFSTLEAIRTELQPTETRRFTLEGAAYLNGFGWFSQFVVAQSEKNRKVSLLGTN